MGKSPNASRAQTAGADQGVGSVLGSRPFRHDGLTHRPPRVIPVFRQELGQTLQDPSTVFFLGERLMERLQALQARFQRSLRTARAAAESFMLSKQGRKLLERMGGRGLEDLGGGLVGGRIAGQALKV